jgi:hypothetical protein
MKSLLGVNPNLWIIMQSLVCQEAETRAILINNAAGLDLTVNQGRKQEQKDIAFRLKSIVNRFFLFPGLYPQCLVKHLNDGNYGFRRQTCSAVPIINNCNKHLPSQLYINAHF